MQNSNGDIKDIKRSVGTVGKWAPESGRTEYSLWSLGECSVVLGAMQQVKFPDKFMILITLFHSDRGY